MITIDENLARRDLSPAERADMTARRKELYEALHPEVSHGAAGVTRQIGDTQQRATGTDRFTKATTDATGQSERSVQRDAERGKALSGVIERVKGTSLGEEARRLNLPSFFSRIAVYLCRLTDLFLDGTSYISFNIQSMAFALSRRSEAALFACFACAVPVPKHKSAMVKARAENRPFCMRSSSSGHFGKLASAGEARAISTSY